MEAPKGVVITGAAGGVGYAYAEEFLRRGHWVVICDVKDPAPAVQALQEKFADGRISGIAADVTSPESVANLGKFAKEQLGTVHYWINNAGINGGRRPMLSLSPETLAAVVNVNLVGILLCTREAALLMQEQKGVQGHIFNTVGSGVKGGGTPGYAAYGASKRGLPQLMASLVKELDEGVEGYEMSKPVGKANVHTMSPGMVFTEMLLNDSTPKLRKFPFGVLAAQPEEVAQDLIPKILATSGNGKLVEFLTQERILTKFFERFIQGKKSEFVDDDGNVVRKAGQEYSDNGVVQQYSGGDKWTPE
jgi:chlorophyll(ide) b reductase